MKRKFFLLLSFVLISAVLSGAFFSYPFSSLPVSYAAEAQYARVVSDDAVLYRTDSGAPDIENKYFTLPKDYYVYLENALTQGFYKVTYDVFTGYVKADDIDIVSYTPKLKYASGQTLKVETPDGGSCNLREFAVKTATRVIDAGIPDETADIKFYNYVIAGADKWYFVEYGGNLGYIFGDYAVITKEIAINDGAAETVPDPSGGSGAKDPKPLDTLTVVILAAVIGIPAIVIMLLLFKPRRRRPAAYPARREANRIPRYLDDDEQ